MMILVGVGIVEVGLAMGVVRGLMSILSAMVVHAVMMALLAAWAWAGGLRPQTGGTFHPLCLLFLVSTAWLGPVGSLGTALTALLWLHFSGKVTGVQDAYAALVPSNAVLTLGFHYPKPPAAGV